MLKNVMHAITRDRPRQLIVGCLALPFGALFLWAIASPLLGGRFDPASLLLTAPLGLPCLWFGTKAVLRWWRSSDPASVEPVRTMLHAPHEIAWVYTAQGARKNNNTVAIHVCTTKGKRFLLMTHMSEREACVSEIKSVAPGAVFSPTFDPSLHARWKSNPAA